MSTTNEQQRLIEQRYDDEYAGYRSDPFFTRRLQETLAEDIAPRLPPPATVLDVGCGSGEFMKVAQEQGYDVEGVDLSEAAATHCRKRGLRARAGNFLTMDFDAPYDLITMWDVVEHLRTPEKFVRRTASLLKPEGYLILKIPGYNRATFFPIMLYNRLAKNLLGAPGHVQYFTSSSLEALLGRCGFEHRDWLAARDFRSRRPAGSLKTKLGRVFSDFVKWSANNQNLYVAAGRQTPH